MKPVIDDNNVITVPVKQPNRFFAWAVIILVKILI